MRSGLIEVATGVRLRVLERRGTAPTAVLVHGLASNARMWDGVGEILTAAGTASVAVDLRGHGESDRPNEGYDFDTMAADVETVVDRIRGPVILVGQSWGGNVVLETAARGRLDVCGVVLVDGGFIRLADEFPTLEECLARLRPPDFTGVTRRELEAEQARRHPDWPRSGLDGQRANFEDSGAGEVRLRLTLDRHLQILSGLYRHDPDPLAEKLDLPVTVLAVGVPGSRPRVDDFAAHLRHGQVVWVDAHHDVHAQRPELVARVIGGMR